MRPTLILGMRQAGMRLRRDRAGQTRRFPGIKAADQIRDVSEAGPAEDAGGDRASVASFAVNHQKLIAVEFVQP